MKRRDFLANVAGTMAAAAAPSLSLAALPAPIHVFRLNDFEWYAGPSLEACIAKWKEYTGCTDEDLDDPRSLTDEEMDSLIFNHTDEDETPYRRQSFRAYLAEQITAGVTFPEFFATTEY
jgi:hypothetical protein